MSKTASIPRTRGFKWHNFLLVCVLGIATGIFLGSWYSYSLLTNTVDYSNYTVAELSDSYEDVISKVLNISKPTKNDLENWLTIAKEKNLTPANLLPSENFILAEYNASKAKSFKAIGNGMVETIASQSVYSEKLYDGNAYFFSSISKGMLTIANLSYMKANSSTVKLIKGTNVTPTSATWNGETKSYTPDQYYDLAGGTPDKINSYIISSKTLLNNRTEDVSKTTYNDKPVYKFSFQLDPVKSVINYVKQVKLTSGLSDYPTFNDITQTVYIDENWNFVRIEIVENYRVTFSGLQPKCKGTLNTDFTFNEPVTLPYTE